MTITNRTKMSAMTRLGYLLKYSKVDFIEEIKKYVVPARIKLIKIAPIQSISIGDMFRIWDVKDNNDLMNLSIKLFLCNTVYKKILFKLLFINEKNLPLIDFTRLIIHTKETGEKAAEMFQSLKIITTDERVEGILKKYKGSTSDMIARYCKLYPAHTQQSAMKVSWYDVYMAFKTDTISKNIDIEIAQLKPLTK